MTLRVWCEYLSDSEIIINPPRSWAVFTLAYVHCGKDPQAAPLMPPEAVSYMLRQGLNDLFLAM
jgi:hypothetical protein